MEAPTYKSTIEALIIGTFSTWPEEQQQTGLQAKQRSRKGAPLPFQAIWGAPETALHYACREGYFPQIPTQLLTKTALLEESHHKNTPLHWCCSSPFAEKNLARIPKGLLEEKDFLHKDSEGYTPLQLALLNHCPLEKIPCKVSLSTLRSLKDWLRDLTTENPPASHRAALLILPRQIEDAIKKETLKSCLEQAQHIDL